ncbi:hypothetical protein B005_0872 [Nocardiopsis alba ATCC BAA-2165]|uniref:Uncharacterized protein n=1 Tax=Nocardiopsis alba (strain ATCC BAA-2165 / BE74) TaxID=1205910 RepID=J7L890_NOCAA|nr:hypothetical protein B005_0872 [Nocardiopsis alba ATCC BAA-2165]
MVCEAEDGVPGPDTPIVVSPRTFDVRTSEYAHAGARAMAG